MGQTVYDYQVYHINRNEKYRMTAVTMLVLEQDRRWLVVFGSLDCHVVRVKPISDRHSLTHRFV
jgi:hypothetical protein